MKSSQWNEKIEECAKGKLHKDECEKLTKFIAHADQKQYVPLKVFLKKVDELKEEKDLLRAGFVLYDFHFWEGKSFKDWYQRTFDCELSIAHTKKIQIYYFTDNALVTKNINQIFESYSFFKQQRVLLNKKNFPVQLGEWYIKGLMGLEQKKSTSQRGFDFFWGGKRVEIKVHWKDHIDKGVKVRKSLLKLSELCVFVYLTENFRLDNICIVDSEFILRKFNQKGHTLFLKKEDLAQYFVGKNPIHRDKVINKNVLKRYASDSLAMRL